MSPLGSRPGNGDRLFVRGRDRPQLDPSPEEMRALGHQAVDLVVQHLDRLGRQPVSHRGTAAELAALVDEPLPQAGCGAENTLAFFFERVVPRMTRVNHPRFHAFIPGPSSFYSALGQILEAGTNPFVGSWLGGATVASLELTVLRWIAEAVGYPANAVGLLTSGGSLANLTALAAARGRFGRGTLRSGVLYFSQQGHASAEKAALLLGYPPESLRRVAVDDRYRLDVAALRDMLEADRRRELVPFLVCANAGTTNTGSIDPLPELVSLCREEGLWLHVDAAYGGFAAICAEGRQRLLGMESADSITLDPHKWLYCPMGTGCVLVRDRQALTSAFQTEGDYLKDVPRDEVNFFDFGPELSRPARVLAVWMLVRTVGLERLAEQVEHDLALARLAERLIAEHPELEIVCPAELSIVTFRHRLRSGEGEEEAARRDHALMEAVLEDGALMISSTDLAGRSALRFVVLNHRSNEAEVRRSVARIHELATATS